MKRLLALLFLAISINGAQAQTIIPAASQAAIMRSVDQNKLAQVSIHGEKYVSVLAEMNDSFNVSELETLGIIVGTKRGRIVTLKIPQKRVELIENLPGIGYAQIATKVRPNLDRAVRDVRADSVHMGWELDSAYTGKGVLIGVTDWGFDYTHPMFYDTAMNQTRILAAWDQYKTSGPAPDGFNYGTEYKTVSQLLAAQSDTANIYSYATHGSHVAGIAGGGGAGTKYRGLAFDAEFLFATFLVDEGAVVDAFEWMYQKSLAEDKRLVINMSWGLYYMGTLDGKSLLSEVITEYIDLGVLFVTSGGNNGDADFHLKFEFNSDTMRTRVGFVPNNAVPYQDGQSISMWGEEGKSFITGFDILNSSNTRVGGSELFNTSTASAYTESDLIVGTDTFHFDIAVDNAHPRNNRPHARLRIRYPPSGFKIVLKATSASGTVHFWNLLETTTGVGNTGWDFTSLGTGYTAGDNLYGIGEPACTESLISVGAHSSGVFNNGEFIPFNIADFSSLGPTLDGRVKPDITAPGVGVISSISSFTDGAYSPVETISFNGREYGFVAFSGTSMSSPVVTGIVAMMLEANPELTPAKIKEILQETAREDYYTGTIPEGGSNIWGQGKVHAWRAVRRASELVGIEETESWMDEMIVYPNPAQHHLTLKTIGQPSHVCVYDLQGQMVLETSGDVNVLKIERLRAGSYFGIATDHSGISTMFRFVKASAD
ncbi:MAG: S8 family peptidase [Flavobacteriales bacterium]